MYADRHLFDGCAAGHLAENRKEQKQENQIIIGKDLHRCELAVSPSELPPSSLSICRKWRERGASQRRFFTYSHFNGNKGHLKLKRAEPRKRLALSKG
jgi:hypothetical protein